MKISLVVLSAGSAAGKALPITAAQFIIGRDPGCNLRPASAMISKRHCAIIIKNNEVFVRDFDSTNGTFVNDTQVKGEVGIKHDDVLKVGPLAFKVVIEQSAAKPTPPPKPKTADIMDDDAAAALLFDDETGNVSVSKSETADDAVPGGSTVMDIPAFGPDGAPTDEQVAAAKQDEKDKKIAGKAKPATGAAQDAAKAILDKLRQGKRK